MVETANSVRGWNHLLDNTLLIQYQQFVCTGDMLGVINDILVSHQTKDITGTSDPAVLAEMLCCITKRLDSTDPAWAFRRPVAFDLFKTSLYAFMHVRLGLLFHRLGFQPRKGASCLCCAGARAHQR